MTGFSHGLLERSMIVLNQRDCQTRKLIWELLLESWIYMDLKSLMQIALNNCALTTAMKSYNSSLLVCCYWFKNV